MVVPLFLKRTVITIKKIFNTTVSVKEGASRNVLRGIVQYDTLNEVNIRLSDGSRAFDYTGYTNIIFKVLKADGTAYVNSHTDENTKIVATSPVDGIVTVTLAGQATTAVGLCQSVIEIYVGEDVLTTARFNYEVFEGLNLDDAVESATEYPVLKNLISEISALEAAIEAAEAARTAAEAIRANEASGYVAQAEQLAAQAQASAVAAQASAQEAQEIATGDYATNSGSQAYTNNQISAHNTNTAAHADIRSSVTTAANAAAAAQSTANAAQTAAAAAKVAADNAQTKANSAATAAATAQTTANGKANATHKHAATDINSGILPVANGGTGVATIAELATALGVGSTSGLQIAVGTYKGSGVSSRKIALSFAPKAVLVVNRKGMMSKESSGTHIYGGLAVTGYPAEFEPVEFITLSTDGFTVKNNTSITNVYIECNADGEEFTYIAIG